MVKHSNNSSAVADELFECVWPFCGVGAYRVNHSVPGNNKRSHIFKLAAKNIGSPAGITKLKSNLNPNLYI